MRNGNEVISVSSRCVIRTALMVGLAYMRKFVNTS